MLPIFPTPPGVARNPGNPILDNPRDLERELCAPFRPSDVEWKGGGGGGERDGNKMLAFPYVDAAAIRRRLNRVCGIGGWQMLPYQIAPGQVGVALAISVCGQWITKADGAWSGDLDLDHVDPTDKKAAAKKADAIAKDAKGAISNALKRAAGAWGIGEYLRQLGRIYEDYEQRGYSRVFTKAARERLDELAAKPFYEHHGKLALRHEAKAREALAKGELTAALGGAKEALRIRHEVFGDDADSTKRVRALFDDVVARQRGVNGEPPATAPAPAVSASVATPGAPPADPSAGPWKTCSECNGQWNTSEERCPYCVGALEAVIQRMGAATTADEVRNAYAPLWERWGLVDSDAGRAFRSAVETNMQRFNKSWTIEGARQAARERAQRESAAAGTPQGTPNPAAGTAPAGRGRSSGSGAKAASGGAKRGAAKEAPAG